jgi:manganese/zinc-transporting P-type ATPase C
MQAAIGRLPIEVALQSNVPGRQRWRVPAIESRPRLAAAVEIALRKETGALLVNANPLTGRVLVKWRPAQKPPKVRSIIRAAIAAGPVTEAVYRRIRGTPDRKLRNLVHKLVLGGIKLGFILVSRLAWGAAGGPLAGPILILSVSGTIITGYDFLRALYRTVTGRSAITTGTLIGVATVSSMVLKESVTALIVIWLLNLGEYLEMITLRRTRAAIRDLLATEEEAIWIAVDGIEVSMSTHEVRPGMVAVARTGRKIPVDGVIQSGEGTINEAPITGESMPAIRGAGDPVYAGTVLLAGEIRIRVTGVGADTVVGRLIERVELAQALRPRIQTVGDQFAKKVVPSSFAAAALIFLVTRDPRRALTMLLVACPCAAGLATPMAVSASIGNSARRGILVKGGTHLESMATLDTVAFDKTGTLTDSQPTVSQVIPCANGYTEERVLSLAARAEIHSQHPLAIAIVQRAGLTGGDLQEGAEFELLAGRGVRTKWEEHEVLVGSRRLLDEFEVKIAPETEELFRSRIRQAETKVLVVHQGRLVGVIAIAVQVRPEAGAALGKLRHAGVSRLVMLTGDGDGVARHVASEVGVTEWKARLLPEEKFEAIRKLRATGSHVAMVGDGINDASALAVADVGFAMGAAGSDVAVETADVALASDDLRHIADVMHISRRTMRVVRQNYSLALGVNSIGLCLAAAGRINPIIAALLHNLSTILVVANSSRLIHYDPVQLPQPSCVGMCCAVPVQQEEDARCGESEGAESSKQNQVGERTRDLSGK